VRDVGTERAATTTRDRPSGRATEPPAARCAPGFEVAFNPATLGTLMAGADAGSRERLVGILQQRHGNAAVQRLLAPAGAPAVQRWAVTLPVVTTDCARVVSYMDANSPYRGDSGWARTNARFNWGGDPAYTTSDGVTTATVTNPTVTRVVNVDMPRWAPTNPAMATAWTGMTTALRAHEAVHEGIATTWESTLRTNLGSLSVTVANRTIGAFRSAVQAEWNTWIGQHQADQTAIDPYTAVLDCSGGTSEGTSESTAPIAGLDGEPDLTGG
jgi:predicted secreted Zn-dependent protease